jgi:hypothetical protein
MWNKPGEVNSREAYVTMMRLGLVTYRVLTHPRQMYGAWFFFRN